MSRVILHREGYWTCESCGGPNKVSEPPLEVTAVTCHWCGVEYGVFPGIVCLDPRRSKCVEFDLCRLLLTQRARGVDISGFFRGAMEQLWLYTYDPIRFSPDAYRGCILQLNTICDMHLSETVEG